MTLSLPAEFNEVDWWGSCVNTFWEETKQLVYAQRMGLYASWHHAHPPIFDLGGRSVIDIGGGPVSLLLKCSNFSWATVVDPARWPEWVHERYAMAGIGYRQQEAEDLEVANADETWIYNCLSHVRDPEQIISKAREHSKTIRIFEWLEDVPRPGHPQTLHYEQLNEWLGGMGFTSNVNENGAVGLAYYGVFATAP